MKYLTVLFVCLLTSCNNIYLIKYNIVGEAKTARIEYINNGVSVYEEIELPYSKEIFLDSDRQIGIHVYNIVASSISHYFDIVLFNPYIASSRVS